MGNILKVSIITAVFNRRDTIKNCIDSIQNQTYSDIEHVIIDGGSTDGTIEVVKNSFYSDTIFISEIDNGLYDAINKGIRASTGSIIGLLHSDDVFASEAIVSQVVSEFSDSDLDAVYADANFFKNGDTTKVVRRFRSDRFSLKTLPWGWMPAHTTIFFRRSVFERFGVYRHDYKIAADMDFVARVFSSQNFKSKYIQDVWINMAIGGVSTGGVRNTLMLNREVLRALRENGIQTNIIKLLSKYPLKILEYSQFFHKIKSESSKSSFFAKILGSLKW